ncbi:hypothetical protein [Paraliobacillus ryukyuensis]|uniref:hypothetical protein n=1 Tax=Paraliobacillus ryukyuensis TaxID=200904 RepID=UPI0009A80384|nr:hypothetical protein [Paraliobacillus ryukyuensis]
MTIELIKRVSVKLASESDLPFIINDVNAILKNENVFDQRGTVKKLEHAFTNANYAGDYKAGEFSFILSDYLKGGNY